MSIFHSFHHGDVVLALVFLLLLGMSVLSWAIIFWKARLFYLERRGVSAFAAQCRKPGALGKPAGDETTILRALLQHADVIAASVSSQARTHELAALHFAQMLDMLRLRLDAGLTALASIGTSAPFIGLFGTIWGVYGTLGRITAERSAGLDVVAGPMGEALVATAAGLFVAIPAVLAYNGFLRASRLMMQDLRHITERLAVQIQGADREKPSVPLKAVKGA